MSDKGDNPYIDEVYDHLRRNFGAGPTSHAHDIREKAERLAAAHRNYANDRDGFADLISQALLEAHNAGREEAAAWHDERVAKMRAEVVPPGEESDLRDMVKRQHIAIHEYAATAIRSIT